MHMGHGWTMCQLENMNGSRNKTQESILLPGSSELYS